MTSWEYQRKHSYDFDSNLAQLEDAPAYEHFLTKYLPKVGGLPVKTKKLGAILPLHEG